MLRRAVLGLLARVPSDRGRIKQNLRATQRRQPRRFRIPLIPANADADVPMRRAEALETEIARREVKLLVERGVIGDVHLAILADDLAIGAEHDRGIVVNAGRAFFEERRDNHDAQFAGELA